MPLPNDKLALAYELQRRLEIRGSLVKWSQHIGFEPALHQELLCKELETASRQGGARLIVMMPPGSAKSTYTSKLFPPWFLAQKPNRTILSCSYSYDLVQGFGRVCRNYVELHGKTNLAFELTPDSKAAGEWETTNGGRYFCAGVNAGIAGHRADLGLIDDPIGSQMDADSLLFRDKLWLWYWNDFMPRLKPGGSIIIVCNRRHEDDLVGRLLDKKRDATEWMKWKVVSLPMIAGDNDPLGRTKGQLLWPEWFNQSMVEEAQMLPRTWSCLYQQSPTPETGDFFKREWIKEYQQGELPKNLRIYCTSDHAVSTRQGSNKTCFLAFGIDEDDDIWILPDIYWQVSAPGDTVEAMLSMVQRVHPITWWAERGHISKSLMPLIQKRCQERKVYFNLVEVTPVRDKRTRAGSFAGRMSMHKVHFPAFASWWPDALFEMMSFTGSGDDKTDDFVDACSLLGLGLAQLVGAAPPKLPEDEKTFDKTCLTGKWLKDSGKQQSRNRNLVLADR